VAYLARFEKIELENEKFCKIVGKIAQFVEKTLKWKKLLTSTTTILCLFIWGNPGEPAPELAETLTRYTTTLLSKTSQEHEESQNKWHHWWN